MKQIIEIEVPDGKKAVWIDNKISFIDAGPKLPQTWEEFCNNNEIKSNEYFIGNDSTICYWVGKKYRQPACKNMIPSKRAAEQHLALMQLHQLRDCYRQGWIPDWNEDKPKYCIESCGIGYKIVYSENSSYFLAFQSEEIARQFLYNFSELIKLAKDLI